MGNCILNLSINTNTMSSKIETKNSSSETQLLDELRSTVITRWDEFDNALPIGASFKSEYQSMKSAYD